MSDLIRVREELIGAGRSRQILLLGYRLHQWPDIADDREVAGIEERMYGSQARMQAKWRAEAPWRDRQKAPLGYGQGRRTANGGIGGVAGRVRRHDHVVAVIASAKKYANQCLIARTLGHGID